MPKRRSCRRTEQEEKEHNRAVSVRKMTDEKLCAYLDGIERASYEDGYNDCKTELLENNSVMKFLTRIEKMKISGIGNVTISKLKKAAQEDEYDECKESNCWPQIKNQRGSL